MLSQKEICKKFGAEFIASLDNENLYLAIQTIGQYPINGLRKKSLHGTCGWFIWCGEGMSQGGDFFKPLYVKQVNEHLPDIEQYLALPPGYRFLISEDYEDIWYDSLLLSM